MKFEKRISPQLRNILKACTTPKQRERVADSHELSMHTFNAMLNGQRPITEITKECLINLVGVAINNAKEMDLSLTEYYLNIN
jgi:hypothetical protein